MIRERGDRKVPVVRLTAPGMLEGEPEVISEWRGVAYIKPEPVFDRPPAQFWDPLTVFPTPQLVGITMHMDLSNTSVMRLDQRATLNERLGLELWAPVTTGRGPDPLDPLHPRTDWDTSTGDWVRARYHHGYVVQYEHHSFIKEMAVNIYRGPRATELYRLEVLNR